MSRKSWLKEFYPEEANNVPVEKAISHSLQKWIGLRKENLEKHELDYPPVHVNGETCSLCYHFGWEAKARFGRMRCIECPLYLLRKGFICDQRDFDNEKDSPFFAYSHGGDPEPMIALLTKAEEESKQKGVSHEC